MGDATISVLEKSLEIVNRITGNSPGSLGLHAAVYFYNENGKYSRFLFLGMAALITEKIRNNDGAFFNIFSKVRSKVELFLIDNKSLIGILLQNLSKAQRIPKIKDLFSFIVNSETSGKTPTAEEAIAHLGLQGRILDVKVIQTHPHFSDDPKSMVFLNSALGSALRCPECHGYLDPKKSVSYDHIIRVQDGGTGAPANGQLSHPYCNTAMKN